MNVPPESTVTEPSSVTKAARPCDTLSTTPPLAESTTHVIDHTTAGRIHNRELSLVGDGVLTSNVGDLVASEVKGSDLARRDDNGFGHVGQKLNGRAVGRGQGGGELR